ncbi:MAG: DUF1559 domain-containing protein, partial [Maioricimonas sp. JB049]
FGKGGTGLQCYNWDRLSGFIGLLPYMDQAPLFNQIAAGGQPSGDCLDPAPPFGTHPWQDAYGPWRNKLAVLQCPSESGRGPDWPQIGRTNYSFCVGDTIVGNNNPTSWTSRDARGMFYMWSDLGLRDITDGSSNTILMGENGVANAGNRSDIIGHVVQGAGADPSNPRACLAFVQDNQYTSAANLATWRGDRWTDGNPANTGFTTILPPNSPSCSESTWDGGWGIFSAGSRHEGGCQVLMGDGAVRFISENIDTGDISAPTVYEAGTGGGESPYGVWGALGTRAGGEVVGAF